LERERESALADLMKGKARVSCAVVKQLKGKNENFVILIYCSCSAQKQEQQQRQQQQQQQQQGVTLSMITLTDFPRCARFPWPNPVKEI